MAAFLLLLLLLLLPPALPDRPPPRLPPPVRRPRTSHARCCTIARAHKVWVTLRCPGGSRRRLQTVSAGACRCDMCRLSRY
ncbi:glycoprotein hormone alpha-2 [Accipiter gentilis]|uniref:glycoprotein hormone alpha-2 n=1 Tax=Astur gentilis TaxID=8957 RepID=UPI00211002FD|nr:glycoprotein hormone alpha-2 [Accipiter gentilis]